MTRVCLQRVLEHGRRLSATLHLQTCRPALCCLQAVLSASHPLDSTTLSPTKHVAVSNSPLRNFISALYEGIYAIRLSRSGCTHLRTILRSRGPVLRRPFLITPTSSYALLPPSLAPSEAFIGLLSLCARYFEQIGASQIAARDRLRRLTDAPKQRRIA